MTATRKRRVKAKQVEMPEAEPPFAVVELSTRERRWTVEVRDAIARDRPVFEVRIPKSHAIPVEDVIAAGRRECNESTGTLVLTEWLGDLPTFRAAVAVGSGWDGTGWRHCLWSTDEERLSRWKGKASA